MARITIAVRVQPYPMLVVALRRITGRDIGPLAAALSDGEPVFEADFDAASADQISRVHQLLSLLRVAVLTPTICCDGNAIAERELLDLLQGRELSELRAPST